MKYRSFTFILCSLLAFTTMGQNKISITVKPAPVYIEKGESRQYVNFDFLVNNNTTDTLTLSKITVSVFNKNRQLVHARFLDNNGTAPSILVIPNRTFGGVSSKLIFNPFPDFSLTTPLSQLQYEWVFTNNSNEEIKLNTVVEPTPFDQKTIYQFPLKGMALVYDAHDLHAHHRRFDYEFAPIKGLGISANFMRYAYDLVPVDNNGKQYTGDGKKDSDYFGLGKIVNAIAGGKVIYASNVHKDDKQFNIPGIASNALELYGNCVAILHPNNSVSIYGHLKQNSLTVKTGDIVKPGQAIGAIGVSGSSFFPHLHFEVRTSVKGSAEGIPSYFNNVFLVEGGIKTKLRSGLVETGNIIEAR